MELHGNQEDEFPEFTIDEYWKSRCEFKILIIGLCRGIEYSGGVKVISIFELCNSNLKSFLNFYQIKTVLVY